MKAESRRIARRLFRAAAVTVLWSIFMLTGMALAARYVKPDVLWFFQLFAIVLPYLAWSMIVTTVMAIVVRQKSLLVFQAILLIAVIIRFLPAGDYAIPDEAHSLSLVSYNSPYPMHRISPENEAEFESILGDAEPNIVGFQETFLGFINRGTERIVGRSDVLNVFGSAGYEISRPHPKTEILFYQPVLTNFPVDSTRKIILPDNPYPIESEILRINFRWEGRPVVLYNIHLASYGASKPWHEGNSSVVSIGFWYKYLKQYRRAIWARAWEAQQIRAMIELESVPVVVLGDFNATRHNWSYATIQKGMVDVLHSTRSGLRMTYHSRYPFARIDHILTSNHFVPVAGSVLNTTRSDHRAIWGRVALAR
ncbi:MAG: hypothetical protein HKN43_16005 [Rhodothermales bacterium]|nr:hypothetical protein [Rhodothermales bacterium]